MPCRATRPTPSDISAAAFSAPRMRRVWEGPLGAVSPLERPSWFTAVPKIMLLLASAWLGGPSTQTTTPSPRP